MAPTPNAIAGALAHIRSASAQADLDAIRALINTALTSAGSIAQTMTVVRYVLRVPSRGRVQAGRLRRHQWASTRAAPVAAAGPTISPPAAASLAFLGQPGCCECGGNRRQYGYQASKKYDVGEESTELKNTDKLDNREQP